METYFEVTDSETAGQRGQPANGGRLMDQMRATLRLHHYAIRTERSYCDWVRRYVKFHGMRTREDLAGGARKVEDFLTHLAVQEKVAASTQNQAFNALLFLYNRVLDQPLAEKINAVRSSRAPRVPVVLTREEARLVIALLGGPAQWVVKLMYGSGLRLMEALRLARPGGRFQEAGGCGARDGKGARDRVTPLAVNLANPLQEHLAAVRMGFETDRKAGFAGA